MTTTTTEVDSTNDDGHLASSLLEIPPPSFIAVVAANMIVGLAEVVWGSEDKGPGSYTNDYTYDN